MSGRNGGQFATSRNMPAAKPKEEPKLNSVELHNDQIPRKLSIFVLEKGKQRNINPKKQTKREKEGFTYIHRHTRTRT